MKIIHLCTGFPISFNGGITNYVRSLANTQIDNGYEVVVICGPGNEHERFKIIEYKDLYIRPFTFRYRKSIIGYKRIENILKKEKPDLLHIHMMLDIDCRLFKILKKLNIKYVVSLHDYSFLCPRIQMYKNNCNCGKVNNDCKKCGSIVEQTFFTNKLFKILKLNPKIGIQYSPNFLKMYEHNKKLLENAELLLPVSNRVKEIYEESDIKNKYEVLHIGNITANQFKKYESPKRIKNEKIKLVMLGNFSHIKGGDEFVRISQYLNQNFELYFLGRSTDEDKLKMKSNGIIDKGSYKQADLPKLLKEYDFGCVLSVWEDNAPQVVMELLNNNIPVIGTQMGGIPDFIKDGHNGFLYDPYSEKSFNKMINKLKEIKRADVETMKQNIERTTTPEEHFEKLDTIYKKILEEK